MADIKVQRSHTLGLEKARTLAQEWLKESAPALGLTCSMEQGSAHDTIHFERAGVKGIMTIRPDAFELDAKLGLMLAPLKPMVEAEIDKRLRRLLERATPGAA